MNIGNNERRLTAEVCALSEATIRNHVVDSDCHVSANGERLILRRVLIREIRLGNAELADREESSRRDECTDF